MYPFVAFQQMQTMQKKKKKKWNLNLENAWSCSPTIMMTNNKTDRTVYIAQKHFCVQLDFCNSDNIVAIVAVAAIEQKTLIVRLQS